MPSFNLSFGQPLWEADRQALAMNQGLLDYGNQYRASVETNRLLDQSRSADAYLSTLAGNQQRAAMMGHTPTEFWTNQQAEIMADPNFQTYTPETQAEILKRLRTQQLDWQNQLAQQGNLYESQQFGQAAGINPIVSDLMIALQAGNAPAVAGAMNAANPLAALAATPQGGLQVGQTTLPPGVGMLGMAQNPMMAGATLADRVAAYQQMLNQQQQQSAMLQQVLQMQGAGRQPFVPGTPLPKLQEAHPADNYTSPESLPPMSFNSYQDAERVFPGIASQYGPDSELYKLMQQQRMPVPGQAPPEIPQWLTQYLRMQQGGKK